jgi:type I restriction enzyme, R subunit
MRRWFHAASVPRNYGRGSRISFNAYTPVARAILDELLDKYADVGLRELTNLPLTLRVPPLDAHGSVPEIAALFGGAEKLKAAVDQMQALLYAIDQE